MKNLKFPSFQKIAALAVHFSFLLQNLLAPFAFLSYAQPVAAADQPTAEVSFDKNSHSFDVIAKTIQSADLTLSYQHPANPEIEGLLGKLQVSDDQIGRGQFLAGTQSGDHITKHEVQNGELQLIGVKADGANYDFTTHFVMKNDTLWVEQGSDTYTTYSVEAARAYTAPQDDQVQLTFNSLPENSGYLQIQKLQLSEEQQAKLGAVSNIAYDITSDMPDGSFSYDLTLPNPAPEKEVVVQYSEDGDIFEEVEGSQVNGDSLDIENLNHFTVFVVTTPPALTGTDCVNVGGTDGCYDSIQAAIDAVDDSDADPDTIIVKNGNYPLPSTLRINKQVTIVGESEVGVIIDGSGNGTGYGVRISADNVTFKNITILPPVIPASLGSSSGGGYAIHVSNTPNLVHNLTLENITIENGNRTSFDIHGADGGSLTNLTARNNAYGNGMSLTGSSNLTVEGFTSSGNAWGGIALYTSTNTDPDRATHNITLLGNTFSIAEDNPIYEENENGLTITGIDAQGYDFQITNDVYRGAGSENFVHYQKTLTDATNFALGLQAISANTASVIRQISTGDYIVAEGMKIQEAIDAASDGDTIHIGEGNFVEQLTIQNKRLTLNGSGKNLTTVESPDSLDTTFTTSSLNKAVIGIIDDADVTVKNLAVDGLQKGQGNYRMIGVSFYNAQGSLDTLLIQNIRESTNSGSQHGTGVYAYNSDSQSREITLRNSEISNYQKNGVAISGENLKAIIENNTITGYGEIYFIAQNGIQLSFGAFGDVTNNTVQGHSYVNPGNTWDRGAAGILLYDTNGPLVVKNNTGSGNDNALYFWDNSGSVEVENNNFSNNFVGIIFGGLTEAVKTFSGNIFSNNPTDLMYYQEGFDLEATYNSWSSNSLDGIEERIEHDCVHSPYSHGVCNATDYEENFGSVNYDPWTGKVIPDTTYPTLSNIKMFVNGQESRLTKPGDVVRIVANATDTESTIEKIQIWVREFPWSPNQNELISGNMSHVTGDTFEFIFTVPQQYKDGDVLNQSYEGNYFNFRPFDTAGNSHIGWRENFTIDATAPLTPDLVGPATDSVIQPSSALLDWTDVSDDHGPVTYHYQSFWGTTGHYGPRSTGSTSQIDASGSQDRTYQWQVQACDVIGNCSAWSPLWTVTIDSVAPEIPNNLHFLDYQGNSLGCGAFTNHLTTTVDWDDVSDAVKYEYTINYPFANGSGRGQWTIYPTNSQYGGSLNQGEHIVKVRAIDAAGNKSDWTDECSITGDTTAPTKPTWGTIYTGSNVNENNEIGCGGYTNSPQVTFQWNKNSEADVDGYWFGTKFKTKHQWIKSGNIKKATMTPGNNPYYYTIIAVDKAGNESKMSDKCGLILDQEFPTSTITAPYESTSNATLITNEWDGNLAGTANDHESHVTAVKLSIQRSNGDYWDGSSWIADPGSEVLFDAIGTDNWNYPLTNPVPDNYTVKSHAVDAAGNQENTAELLIIYDQTIPEVKLTLNPAQPDGQNNWYITEPIITLKANDDQDPNYGVDYIEYQWDNEANWTRYAQPFPVHGEGSHLLTYRAVDKAGNPSKPGLKTIQYDASELTNGPLNVSVSPNPTRQKEVTVKWEAAQDNIGIVRYDVSWSENDGDRSFSKSFSSDVFETQIDQLREGEWTVKVKASDGAGHFIESNKGLTIDITPPSSPNLSLSNYSGGTVTLNWNDVEDGDNYIVLYGSSPGDYPYAKRFGDVTTATIDDLNDEPYYFVVKAEDKAKNHSGNSNEVSTSTENAVQAAGVGGATATQEPLAGFEPVEEVLGTDTQNESSGQDNDQDKQAPAGEVLGASVTNPFTWWWLAFVFYAIMMLITYVMAMESKPLRLVGNVIATALTSYLLYRWLPQPLPWVAGLVLLSTVIEAFFWLKNPNQATPATASKSISATKKKS